MPPRQRSTSDAPARVTATVHQLKTGEFLTHGMTVISQLSQEHALTVEHARPIASSFLELMHALLVQRAIVPLTVLVLAATALNLLTINKSAKVKDEGKKWLLKPIQ